MGLEDAEKSSQVGEGMVAYSVVERTPESSTVSVIANGRTLDSQKLAGAVSSAGVREAAHGLRQRYLPQVSDVAKRIWRVGGTACLTTSWSSSGSPSSDSSPETSDAQ